MTRILTGIQASGIPHLGNLLGAIIPAIEISKKEHNEGFYFIADYHALTSLKDKILLQENIYSVVATWLAFGLDTNKHLFYKQSDVTEVMELAWVLNCFTPYMMLAKAHSFKDKQENLTDVNAGLFTYPALMAADILLYDANFVPVGKDQKQHIEMTRDIAIKFNLHYNTEFFTLPEAIIDESVMTIPGIDGRKMSKSYGNTINIFVSDKDLKKMIGSIVTDSTPLEEPKNPDTCNVFALYQLLANKDQITDLKNKYLAGNFGYGHAKTELYNLICETYKKERLEYQKIIHDKSFLISELEKGARKAKDIASKKIQELRQITGYALS
jgi:tryptophanyl-tRNA synthetase